MYGCSQGSPCNVRSNIVGFHIRATWNDQGDSRTRTADKTYRPTECSPTLFRIIWLGGTLSDMGACRLNHISHHTTRLCPSRLRFFVHVAPPRATQVTKRCFGVYSHLLCVCVCWGGGDGRALRPRGLTRSNCSSPTLGMRLTSSGQHPRSLRIFEVPPVASVFERVFLLRFRPCW